MINESLVLTISISKIGFDKLIRHSSFTNPQFLVCFMKLMLPLFSQNKLLLNLLPLF